MILLYSINFKPLLKWNIFLLKMKKQQLQFPLISSSFNFYSNHLFTDFYSLPDARRSAMEEVSVCDSDLWQTPMHRENVRPGYRTDLDTHTHTHTHTIQCNFCIRFYHWLLYTHPYTDSTARIHGNPTRIQWPLTPASSVKERIQQPS